MNNEDSPSSSPKRKQKDTSSEESPQKTNAPEKAGGRKIPETLIGSYDLVTLKEGKKIRFNFKRSQSKQEPTQNPQLEKLKHVFGECSCSQDMKQQFTETVFQLSTSLLALSKICSMRIRNISKIKLVGESNRETGKISPKLIKITWKCDQGEEDDNIYIKLKTIQQAYFLFTSIITRKMLLEDFAVLDISYNQNKTFEGSLKSVEGNIYKASTFMRKWQKKKAKLDDKLTIFKQEKSDKDIKNISEIWTRFTMHNGYFVVKMFQGMEKIQLGIPLIDYSNVQSEKNWLFLLAKIIK